MFYYLHRQSCVPLSTILYCIVPRLCSIYLHRAKAVALLAHISMLAHMSTVLTLTEPLTIPAVNSRHHDQRLLT
jgi:hypothetical protein